MCQGLRKESLAYQCKTTSFICSFIHLADLDKMPITFIASTLLNAGEVLMRVMEMMTITNT